MRDKTGSEKYIYNTEKEQTDKRYKGRKKNLWGWKLTKDGSVYTIQGWLACFPFTGWITWRSTNSAEVLQDKPSTQACTTGQA